MSCPNDETLLRMVERSLEPGRFGEIEVHLDSCEHCRKAVAALALGSRSPSVPNVPFADLELPKNAVIHDRYEVGIELGHGGMGTVFLARDRTLGRNVALKLHRAGSGSERLQREAIAMAKLAHPNVVNVFEVAAYEDRMFVAMEYVKGGTLRSWLAEAPRTWRAIVAMLAETGRGLVAAHAAGLVHRDFKPENVLVGEDGRPRVGDFGLARTDYTPVLADPNALATAMTVTGGLAGTPAYMAPEQLDGSMVDTRCDQFAFCVVAWEALYGARPFSGLTLSALHDSIVRHSLETPPTRVPDRVRKVIVRGLSTDPAQRFPDMETLLVALRAAAAPQTKRNLFATVVALAAVAGGGYAVFTTVAARQRIAACEHEANRAHAAFADPARAVLEAGFIATGKPLARAAFARTAATFDRYTNGLADAARATCSDRDQVARVKLAREMCIAQRRDELIAVVAALSTPDPANVARGPDAAWAVFDPSPCSDASIVSTQTHAPADFAKLAEIKADVETARYREGAALATAFLGDARARKDQGLELDITLLLAELDEELDAKLGISQYNDAETLAEAQGRDLDAAIALDHLAGITGTDVHDHTLANRQIALARAKLARIGGNAAIEARLDMTEAQVLVEEMKLADAEKSIDAGISKLEKVYGGEHPNVAQGYGVLAQVLRAEGRLPDALNAARHTLAVATATLGEDHPTTAGAKMTLAQSMIDSGQLGDARTLLEQADTSFQKVYGEIHPLRAAIQGNLCEIALVQQRYADALANATLARDILAKAEGPDALAVAGPERDRSVALGALNRLDDAAVAAKRALELIEKAGPDGEQRLPGALSDLCEVELAQDKPRDCLVHAQRAVALIEAKGKDSDPLELGDARYLVARAMWESADHAQALKIAAQAAEEHPLAERRKIIADWIAAHQK